jgi:hypothetical protein
MRNQDHQPNRTPVFYGQAQGQPRWRNFGERPPSRHSSEAFSTVPHLPKLGHIGQTVNARGSAYATCRALHKLVSRQGRRRGFGIAYC